MKNEEYQMSYKYGRKIGRYEADYEMSVKFFKVIFGKKFKCERKRIKWLSNYELQLLLDELTEYLGKFKKNVDENDIMELSKHKSRIFRLLE